MHCVRWPHFPYIFWRARMACAMMLRISQMSRMPFKLHLLLSFCSQRSTVGKQGDSDQDKKAYIQLFLPMRLPFPIRLSSIIFLRWCPLREKINKIKEHSCRHAHLPEGVCSTAMCTPEVMNLFQRAVISSVSSIKSFLCPFHVHWHTAPEVSGRKPW